MAMNACAWFGTFLCCVLCSGMVCFVIFGGTVFVTFLALFTAINECEGPDLVAAQKCVPLVGQLVNATINFEPRFDDNASDHVQKLVEMCGDTTRCMKEVKCLSYRIEFIRTGKSCDVYAFIKEEFGQCAQKLKQKAQEKNVDCLNFLFQKEDKCEGWVENQKCIDQEIQEECGHNMLKRFGQISKDFMLATCKRTERVAATVTSRL